MDNSMNTYNYYVSIKKKFNRRHKGGFALIQVIPGSNASWKWLPSGKYNLSSLLTNGSFPFEKVT